MRGMPFNPEAESKRALEIAAAAEALWRIQGARSKEGYEPRSVLDHRRSPSPPTSSSTLSSSLGGSVAAVSENPPRKWPSSQGTTSSGAAAEKEEWASELQPIPPALDMALLGSEKCGPAMEDWDSVLSEPNIAAATSSSPGQDQSFLRWIMGETEESFPVGLKQQNQHQMLPQNHLEFTGGDSGEGFGLVDTVFGFDAATSMVAAPSASFPFLDNSGSRILPSSSNPNLVFSSPQSLSLPQGLILQEPAMAEKSQLYGPNIVHSQQQTIQAQNPAFVLPYSNQQPNLLSPNPKRLNSMVDPSCQVAPRFPAFNPGHDLFLRRQQHQSFESLGVLPRAMKAKTLGEETPPQAVLDQLLEAAEMVESGNFGNAREILARLNHQLSPVGKPLLRSAFYCKEALQSIVSDQSASISPLSSPLDVVLKLSAFKAFSEISPLLQFTNFTCTQALLEELNGCDRIHIIDFDIGVGSQWSSFMQELAQRRCAISSSSPSLKLTAIASLSSFHPFELNLTRENLSHFACELNIPFEFNVLGGDSFDPGSILGIGEAVAVNLPSCSLHRPNPNLLRLVKQLSPKIVVCVDHGWDLSDFTFPRHFLHVLQSAAMLLDSIDAACRNLEVVSKIERYLLQPKIQNSITGRHNADEKATPLWNIFASAGLSPLSFSNFAESQAECLMKRIQIKGFHVEKRQSSLLLCWQRGGLASVSAWSC